MLFTTRRKQHTPVTTATSAPRHSRGIFTRRRQAPIQQRKSSLKDKLSGALTKLRGSLTRRSGVKATGARRMRGTNGRGSHRHGHRFF